MIGRPFDGKDRTDPTRGPSGRSGKNRFHSAVKPADSKEEVNMRTTSGRGSGAVLALLAAILMPLLGFSTANAQGVGDKVNLLVPDLQEFPSGAQSRQFTVLAETQHALWLVQDTSWVDEKGGDIEDPALTELVLDRMFSMDELNTLTSEFEGGGVDVWGTVTSIWGAPVDTDGRDKIWIVLACIPSKWNTSQSSQGPRQLLYYVNPADLEGEFNAADIFYLNLHAFSLTPQLPDAYKLRRWNLANGLAALSRYSRNTAEEPWVVRGLAEAAQWYAYGFTSSNTTSNSRGHFEILKEFEKASSLDLTNGYAGNGFQDWRASRGQGFLFFMYLRQRAGDAAIQRIAQGSGTGMLNVALGLNPSANPETAVQDEVVPLYWDWLVCNINHRFLSSYAGGIYMYDFLLGTPYEDFGHANARSSAGFIGKFNIYPFAGFIPAPSQAMAAPVWAAHYSYFRDLTGAEGPVRFNGQYSDGSGGESAVAGRWEGKVVSYNEATGEFLSVTDVTMNDFYNGSFNLAGDASYFIVTNNNPGGAVNTRYYLSQDYAPPSLEIAVHQNLVSDNYAMVYAVPVDETTLAMEGFDWVGPIFSITRGEVTTPVKMEKFYGGMMWRGAVSLTSDGNYTLNFAGFDSSGYAITNSAQMAVGTAGSGLILQVRGIRLDVPEGGAAPGSRVVLSETGMLGLSLNQGASLAEAAGALTGVLEGPVSIPSVTGTLSFPARTDQASIYRHSPDGWVRMDSYFQAGRICAAVSEGGIYVLGQAPGVTSPSLPAQLVLSGNHPNPFSAQTVISFATPAQGLVTMRVFDLSGRLVRTLANEEMAAANHSIIWDGTDANGRPLGAGVYFCRLEAQGQVLTQKIMMVE